MVLGPKPMVKPTSWMWKTRFLDRTKALHGPRTQAYGKTNFLDVMKTRFLDRTKALHGSRTQAYGKTNYLDEEPTKKKTMARKPQNPSEEDS